MIEVMPRKERWKKPLGKIHIDQIPEKEGVYGFWHKNGRCIYIGKTEDQTLRERVIQHWKESKNRKLREWIKHFGDDLEICYNDKTNNPYRLEIRLIRLFNPETNDQHQRRFP